METVVNRQPQKSGLSSLRPQSTSGSVLQAGLSVASGLMMMRSGREAAKLGFAQQRQTEADARAVASRARQNADFQFFAADEVQAEAELAAAGYAVEGTLEHTRGQQEITRLIEDLNRTVASNRVAYAASGVDAFSGTAANRQRSMDANAQRDIDQAASNAKLAELSALLKASQVTRQASSQVFAMQTQARQAQADASIVEARGIQVGHAQAREGLNQKSARSMQGLSTIASGLASIGRRG